MKFNDVMYMCVVAWEPYERSTSRGVCWGWDKRMILGTATANVKIVVRLLCRAERATLPDDLTSRWSHNVLSSVTISR